MKPTFKLNKWMVFAIGLVITLALYIFGHGHNAVEGAALANVAAVSLSDAEKEGLNESEQKVVLACKKITENMKESFKKGLISKEEIGGLLANIKLDPSAGDEAKTLKEQLDNLQNIAKKQGTTLQEISLKMDGGATANKSIAAVLEENKEELQKVYNTGSGTKQFMIHVNNKGEFVARPFDPNKAAGPHATIADVGTAGNTASISNSLDAATILRLGAGSSIISQYRNTPWIFELCNQVNVGFALPIAMWYEEQAKQGASANVAEGGTKPVSQYAYALKSAQYRKEATLLGFTDEFAIDFEQLQSDAIGKGRTDLVNRMNTAILSRITSAATAFDKATEFKGGTAVTSANDFDVLAALASQVDSATFGANANAAVMSTYKKYRMGVLKSTAGEYLNMPEVLANLTRIGNPAMGTDDVMVGDFKQYNILLRGGMIMKVGFNGTDFAENRFSVVLEQFYWDYISSIRAAAIVKGPDFATVKAAIGA